MGDTIGMVFLVKGDGRLGTPKPYQGGMGVDDVHLLLSDTALPVGFICLGALEDHVEALGLEELIVFLLGTICRVANLWGRLLGLALLAEGATDVALHASVVCLPPWNGQGDSSTFSKCSSHAACPWGRGLAV